MHIMKNQLGKILIQKYSGFCDHDNNYDFVFRSCYESKKQTGNEILEICKITSKQLFIVE